MTTDVTFALVEYLSDNLGPDPDNPGQRRRPVYGIEASLTAGVLDVAIAFLAGRTYCCFEPGCHLALHEGERWKALRRGLAAAGIAVPSRLELRLVGVVEEGAERFDLARPDRARRGWYAFAPSRGYRYRTTVIEGEGESS